MKEFFFDARKLYYRTNGFDSAKQTILFIHGLSGSSSGWAKYEVYFKEKYNIVSFDLRGHGVSARPKTYDEYSVEKSSEDVEKLLEYLHIKQCIVISHSLGSLIGLKFLTEYQEKIITAIFLAPPFLIDTRKTSKFFRTILLPVIGINLFLPSFRKKGRHIDYSFYEHTGDWNIRRIFADVRNTGLKPYFYTLEKCYLFETEHLLPEVYVPTLIIQGDKDTLAPLKYTMSASQKMKNSKVHILHNANHILIFNNTAEICGLMENFLEKNVPVHTV